MTQENPGDRRRVLGLAMPELVAFALYCCVQVWMCLVHEAWGDEAQAWLLARDSSLLDLFYRRLHYEGTPGLWHLLLWVETRIGVSYRGMHFITSGLGALGVYLFLRFAPLPRWLKLLFPFLFAILYQGPIVARNYLLILPLIAALSLLRREARQRPLAYAVLLGLLVNTSALGALLAIGLLVEWLFSAVRGRWRFATAAVLQAALVTVLLWGAALYTILPAPDGHFGFLGGLASRPAAAHVLGELTGTPYMPESRPEVATAAATTSATDTPSTEHAHRNRWQQKLAALKYPPGKVTFAVHLLRYALLVLSFAFFVISPSNLLAIAFYAALLLWLARHRALHFALPFLLLAAIGPKLYISPHHAMVWWFALLGLLWTAWPQNGPRRSSIDFAFSAVLALVLVQQVVFAAHALYFDSRYAFDGGEAAERFITTSAPPGTVAGYTFLPVSLQPYSRTNLFINRATTYERWRPQDNVPPAIESVGKYHPRMVVIGESYSGTRDFDNQIVPISLPGKLLDAPDERVYLTSHGFVETHRFCGDQPIDLGSFERVCQVIFEPVASQQR